MSKAITDSSPKKDGYYMPGEYAPQSQVWMIWPQRCDNWRDGGKPAQQAYCHVAKAIARFTPVTMLVNHDQYENARAHLPEHIRVIEMSSNDAWCRDIGPTFVINKQGDLRGIDWRFNAWGGLYDGLYFPWDKDDMMASKICNLLNIDYYHLDHFVLEGGSFHVDGEGTVLTTEMCLLSPGRNPHLNKEQIENYLKEYLNCEKVIWIKDGIDEQETNGHIDDVACFIRPGEVACIYTDDINHPFYRQAQAAFETLQNSYDAKGRKLKVHPLTLTKKPVILQGSETIDQKNGSIARKNGELCIASYLNFLITNHAIIAPQYDDENDALALKQLQAMFPDYEIVGVKTKEIVYGGGNIHCITQQQPKQ